jgi:hypothetical protein
MCSYPGSQPTTRCLPPPPPPPPPPSSPRQQPARYQRRMVGDRVPTAQASRRVVSSKDAPNDVEGNVLIEWWVRTLGEVSDGCVEVDSSSQVVFDHFLFGSPRILSLWPSLSASPILSSYTWFPLVPPHPLRHLIKVHPHGPGSGPPEEGRLQTLLPETRHVEHWA